VIIWIGKMAGGAPPGLPDPGLAHAGPLSDHPEPGPARNHSWMSWTRPGGRPRERLSRLRRRPGQAAVSNP